MTRYPKISIVTPSYNQGRYIEQTIQSVLDQNYPNLEYIIIDAGSTDNTVEIIKKYEQHISYWVSEKDNGQTDAINKGFVKCTGDIFNWLNSDDYYEPGTFFKLAEIFTANPTINIVCGKEWGFNDANPSERILHPGSIVKENVFETILTGIIDQPCTFFRKNVIDDLFPLDNSLHYVMDRQLWWRYLLKYGQQNILQINDVFTNFRLHSQSKTVSEAVSVENEFDRLKLSLFETLQAPEILKSQLAKNDLPLHCNWNIDIQSNLVLAAFASYYAERNYVKDDLQTTSKLMKYVKEWKQGRMNQKERKLWMAANTLPHSLIIGVKKLKKAFNLF